MNSTMTSTIIGLTLCFVIWLYFSQNQLGHSKAFMMRRFVNWFPMGMTYAFLYMARYNLSISKNALGSAMTNQDFGYIFGVGTIVYGLSFLLNGPLVDKMGGKKGILIAALGSSLANIGMGIATYMFLMGKLTSNLTLVFTILYSLNMFFQSYGAVSIIKVKAYWFHVRERGVFGAIFGTLISFGAYFAFDWGKAIVEAAKVNQVGEPSTLARIFQTLFAVDMGTQDAIWLVFLIPAGILIFWAMLDAWLIKDTPSQANFEDFDTADASSGEMDRSFTIGQLLHRIFTNPIMLIFACIEFTSGVLRNGIMQWYPIFSKQVVSATAPLFTAHWGFLICMFGIFGGFAGGLISDRMFHSRRGPPVAIFNFAMFICIGLMAAFLFTAPYIVGFASLGVIAFVIGVHSLMSGTAAADFGGRKATATASGILDGFVYLGSGLQSIALGHLISDSNASDWQYWPLFMLPFTVLAFFLALRVWKALPEATRKYLTTVEKVTLVVKKGNRTVITTSETIKTTPTS